MNKVILMGRLTRHPEIFHSQGENSIAVARFTLAVDRRFKRAGEPDADFLSCRAFGKTAEFADKYLNQGTKVVAVGRIQTGSYTNREGQKVYTTDIIVEELEFAESKNASSVQHSNTDTFQGQAQTQPMPAPSATADGFMNIPDGIDEDLPFLN